MGPCRPGSDGTPGAQVIPKGFETTKLRCNATGCTFMGVEYATTELGPGIRPYCQHHATGGVPKVADLMWRLPCACVRGADGFSQLVGGYSATHAAAKCLERTLAAQAEDLTVPMGTWLPAMPVEGTQIFSDRRCACGKRFDGSRTRARGVSRAIRYGSASR